MASLLKRAYIAPGEYCIFYQHHFPRKPNQSRRAYEQYIGHRALRRLLYSLQNHLHIANIPLSRDIRARRLQVVRVHTVDPHDANLAFISCVVVELRAPRKGTWLELAKGIKALTPPYSSVHEARSIYRKHRLDVLKSVASIYDPTNLNSEIVYKNPHDVGLLYVNQDYFDTQRTIISLLGDSNVPLFLGESIAAVSPNWLMAPSPNSPPPVDSGGPGSRPIAVTVPPRGSLRFHDGANKRWWETGTVTTPVHVAVFDSVPSYPSLRDNLTRLRSRLTPPHRLLESFFRQHPATANLRSSAARVGGNVVEAGKLHIIYDGLWHAVQPTQPPTGEDPAAVRRHPYLMPDHGIFVGGIIHALEPSADIYLIQVLNDYGVGNLESLWAGFARYWEYWYSRYAATSTNNPDNPEEQPGNFRKYIDNLRMVFNCSLGFDAPPLHDLEALEKTPQPQPPHLAQYYEKVGQDVQNDELYKVYAVAVPSTGTQPPARPEHEFMAQLWPSFDGLRKLFSKDFFNIHRKTSITNRDHTFHVLIAAAGNNRVVGGPHPSALYPASDPVGVGVGALQTPIAADEKIADYSNIADTPPEDGIYVFGGTAAQQPVDPDSLSPYVNAKKGLVSLYLGILPSTRRASQNGLAEWAGTSFATPIVSGIVAALLARGERLPVRGLDANANHLLKDEATVPTIDPALARVAGVALPLLPMRVMRIVQDH